jgi:predicted component of viral defense system (DUF524 family)
MEVGQLAVIPQDSSNLMSLTGYLALTNIFSSSQLGQLMSFTSA